MLFQADGASKGSRGQTTNAKALMSRSDKVSPHTLAWILNRTITLTAILLAILPFHHKPFEMAPKQESSKAEVEHKTKKFGKTERKVPHHTQKAKKFYPAEEEAKPKKVREAHL